LTTRTISGASYSAFSASARSFVVEVVAFVDSVMVRP